MKGIHRKLRFSGKRQGNQAGQQADLAGAGRLPLTLLDVPLGCHAKIGAPPTSADPNSSAQGLDQLQAYGLASGYWVRVLQRTPVIVVQIDHLELAMENELASRVPIEEICSSW